MGLARGGSETEREPLRLASAQRSERSCGHWCDGLGSRRRRAGAPALVQPQRAEEPGLCRELGGNVWTGPRLLSALRRPRLPLPRARATAGKAAETADFLRSEGRPAGRTVPGLQSGTPRRRGPLRAMEPGLQEA